MGLRIFLRDRIDFAAKTEIESVLEYICRIEVGLRIFFFQREERREIGLRKFLSKKQKGEKQLDLKYFVLVKREEESKVKQVRRRVRSPAVKLERD